MHTMSGKKAKNPRNPKNLLKNLSKNHKHPDLQKEGSSDTVTSNVTSNDYFGLQFDQRVNSDCPLESFLSSG